MIYLEGDKFDKGMRRLPGGISSLYFGKRGGEHCGKTMRFLPNSERSNGTTTLKRREDEKNKHSRTASAIPPTDQGRKIAERLFQHLGQHDGIRAQ